MHKAALETDSQCVLFVVFYFVQDVNICREFAQPRLD